jgi:hypothetical protein
VFRPIALCFARKQHPEEGGEGDSLRLTARLFHQRAASNAAVERKQGKSNKSAMNVIESPSLQVPFSLPWQKS